MNDTERALESRGGFRLSRRGVVVGALAVAALGGAGWTFERRRRAARRRLLLDLASRAGLPGVATPLGAEYLLQHPAEADVDWLVDELVPARIDADPGALERLLVERIDREYVAHDVVGVDGWIFARSEARLLALVALLEAPRSDAG